jgi:hypothetical protein
LISAYADEIMIKFKHRGNLNRVIKMVETVFGKLNLKLNKKKCGIMRIMKKALKKAETKEAEGIKFINQYKYLGLNLQNSGKLTANIDSLKIKLKKMTKMIFYLTKNPFPPWYSKTSFNKTSLHISGILHKLWAKMILIYNILNIPPLINKKNALPQKELFD